jgi:hypothetical protein
LGKLRPVAPVPAAREVIEPAARYDCAWSRASCCSGLPPQLAEEDEALSSERLSGERQALDAQAGEATQRLLAGAEPEDGDAARPSGADWFQVDPGEARRREADAVSEQYRQYVHQDLVDEAPLQALGGDVGAEDLQALAARGAARRGYRLSDVTGEVRDARIRGLRWTMGEDNTGPEKG